MKDLRVFLLALIPIIALADDQNLLTISPWLQAPRIYGRQGTFTPPPPQVIKGGFRPMSTPYPAIYSTHRIPGLQPAYNPGTAPPLPRSQPEFVIPYNIRDHTRVDYVTPSSFLPDEIPSPWPVHKPRPGEKSIPRRIEPVYRPEKYNSIVTEYTTKSTREETQTPWQRKGETQIHGNRPENNFNARENNVVKYTTIQPREEIQNPWSINTPNRKGETTRNINFLNRPENPDTRERNEYTTKSTQEEIKTPWPENTFKKDESSRKIDLFTRPENPDNERFPTEFTKIPTLEEIEPLLPVDKPNNGGSSINTKSAFYFPIPRQGGSSQNERNVVEYTTKPTVEPLWSIKKTRTPFGNVEYTKYPQTPEQQTGEYTTPPQEEIQSPWPVHKPRPGISPIPRTEAPIYVPERPLLIAAPGRIKTKTLAPYNRFEVTTLREGVTEPGYQRIKTYTSPPETVRKFKRSQDDDYEILLQKLQQPQVQEPTTLKYQYYRTFDPIIH